MTNYPDRIDSKFRYVLLSATRAEQLMRGAPPKLAKPVKPTSLGMVEVSQDLVDWDYGLPEPPAAEEETAEAIESDEGAEAEAS